MGNVTRKRASSLELGVTTRQQLGYIMKNSDTVTSMVGVVRGLAKKHKEFLQLQLQVEKAGGTVQLQVLDRTGAVAQTLLADFRL